MLPKILHQTDQAVYASKPSGMFVHPTDEQRGSGETLLTWIRDRVGQFVYPVHRIDRASSGIVCMGMSSESAAGLQSLIQAPQAIKSYLVLVRGDTPLEFECDLPLSRKKKETPVPALTHFRKVMGKNGFSLLEARIETGRRHQIRRHLARLGHQVVGDSTYGKGRINDSLRRDHGLPRLFLHAYLLDHPGGNASISEHRQIDPLPADLLVFLRLLFDEPQLLPGGFLEEAGETC
ncbi:MAG: pseudouridylate synthase [Planctomycetes bacterium]|nr:pseudouridylate synthase [Planctomycetota bacterium]